jgi:hypothetical protein
MNYVLLFSLFAAFKLLLALLRAFIFLLGGMAATEMQES